jgi:hypothetical protein
VPGQLNPHCLMQPRLGERSSAQAGLGEAQMTR